MSIPNRVWFSLLENQKTFCFSYCDNFMQIKISSLLPYPNITIKRPHLTLLTIYILWAIFPPKEVLASCFRIQSKQQYLKKLWPGIKMHYKKGSCQSTFLRMLCSNNKVVLHAYVMPTPYVTPLIKKMW